MNYLIDKNTGMFVLKEFKALGGQSEVSNVGKFVGTIPKTETAPGSDTTSTAPSTDTTPTTDSDTTFTSSTDATTIENFLDDEQIFKYLSKIKLKQTTVANTYNFVYAISNSSGYKGSSFEVSTGLDSAFNLNENSKSVQELAKLYYKIVKKSVTPGSSDFASEGYTKGLNELLNFDSLAKGISTYLKNLKNSKPKPSPSKKNPVKESKILKEYREEINSLLIPSMQKQLKFNTLPILNFVEDEENAKDMFGRTAHYNPNTSEITVYISGRHPKDIMRSVAHEVVHHAQNCRGEFDNAFNLGEEGYAQSNNHLRKMEKQAYLLGNMLFRDWEDNLKKQRNTTAMINEQALRAKIRQLIAEAMQDASEVENAPTSEQHEKSCSCPECTDKRNFLRKKSINTMGKLAEATRKVVQEDKEIMPLNEWRRLELNSLLLNRFGIVSPEVLGEKKKMPMKKDTKDVDGDGDTDESVPAFLEKGDVKKPKAKKGQIPPQLKAHIKGKKHESK